MSRVLWSLMIVWGVASPGFAADVESPRLLVLTDIGGDPDDQQSMIRLMLYANEFDIEGLIATAAGDGRGNGETSRGSSPFGEPQAGRGRGAGRARGSRGVRWPCRCRSLSPAGGETIALGRDLDRIGERVGGGWPAVRFGGPASLIFTGSRPEPSAPAA